MKWEYMDFYLEIYAQPKNRINNLNELGQEGWEAVCLIKDYHLLLKRQIKE